MIFNEVYSAYYNTVAKIISSLLDGKKDDKALNQIVADTAFGESMLTILPSLKSEKWQLIKEDMTTPIKHIPTMPLTLIQKRWLKAISLDPRIRLFDIDLCNLDGVEPLFTSEDYFVYDKYADGDPYTDSDYIKKFRTILFALNNQKGLQLEMITSKGKKIYPRCFPEHLEYSEKDDKFRLVTKGCTFIKTVNLARIISCSIYNGEVAVNSACHKTNIKTVTLKVSEERNTLERCMLHFAHFEKRAEKVGEHYLLHIKYDIDDESEMVIRILSFGPTVKVIESDSIKNLITEKLKNQKSCELK